MGYDFKFSVVMPIYNVERYIAEAVDSLINQSIGFEENIELIIVDDESPDNSKDIALEYQEKYPDNIKVLSKPNGGQASAFNLGLNHVSGRYVSFIDSDDYVSLNTFEEVYNFFEEHYDEVDLVSIPIMFFERSTGPHMLNYKFKTTRVIDLIEQPHNPQFHIGASFVKREALEGLEFNTDLLLGYDALMVNKILLPKKSIGVISSAFYYYRKRNESTSIMDDAKDKKGFYTQALKEFNLALIEYYKEKDGYVPKFIQYAVAYHLKGYNVISDFPEDFTEEEKIEFWETLYEILTYIDQDVLEDTRIVKIENIKSFLMFIKNNSEFHVEVLEEGGDEQVYSENESDSDEEVGPGVLFKTEDFIINSLHHNRIYIDNIQIDGGIIKLDGTVSNSSYSDALSIEVVKTSWDGIEESIEEKIIELSSDETHIKKILSVPWHFKHSFSFEIPFNPNENSKIELHLIYDEDGKRVVMKNKIRFRDTALLADMINYFVKDSHIIYFSENSFNICPYSDEKIFELKQELLEYIQNLLETQRDLRRENRSLNLKNGSLDRKNQSLNRRNESLKVEKEKLKEKNKKLKDKNEKLKNKNEKLKNKNQDLKVSLKKSRDKNKEMINSTSWKITKPLRMPKQYLSKRKSS